ncbi:MAG: hypothetical protein RL173_202 [Fibrobacterota bacterium]|jgi:capsule polysaccharide export protein KpsE/RkpR
MQIPDEELADSRAVRFSIWVKSLKTSFAICLLTSLAVGFIYPWFIAKPEYLSKVVFVPPPESQGQLLDLIGMKDRMFSSKNDISNEQIGVIFQSETFSRRIIDRFELIRRYETEGVAKYSKATKRLNANVTLAESKSSGIGYSSTQSFEIRCWDRSADTAKLICEYAFNLLDSSIVRISSNRAQSVLDFSIARSAEAKRQLEINQTALIDYQKKTRIAEPVMQTQMMMEASARLSQKLTEAKFSKILSSATQGEGNSSESTIKALQNGIEAELQKIQTAKNSRLPSLTAISEGAPRYYALMGEVEIQIKVLGLLRQQEELSRLDVSKTRSSLYLIDSARAAEYKGRPKRMVLALVIVLSGLMIFLLVSTYVFFSKELMANNQLVKLLLSPNRAGETK